MFDWASLREGYRSYIDSIVIELCLPNSRYPKYILARILEDATQEAPREKRRFPQVLFDALGDLAVSAHALPHPQQSDFSYVIRLHCNCKRRSKHRFSVHKASNGGRNLAPYQKSSACGSEPSLSPRMPRNNLAVISASSFLWRKRSRVASWTLCGHA
jgi:hypothetical protein